MMTSKQILLTSRSTSAIQKAQEDIKMPLIMAMYAFAMANPIHASVAAVCVLDKAIKAVEGKLTEEDFRQLCHVVGHVLKPSGGH